MITELTLADGATVALRVDDFADGWRSSDPVIFLHGLAESGEAWRGFVPYFARRHRVVRPDMRGFGASVAMRADFPWRFETLHDDLTRTFSVLGIERAHLVGAKIGGTFALSYAAHNPERIASVTAIGSPLTMTENAEALRASRIQIRDQGVEAWVRATSAHRLGADMPEAARDWWVRLMSHTPRSTLLGFLQMVEQIDIREAVMKIEQPALILTSPGGFVSTDYLTAWQAAGIERHVEILGSISYHIAASDPDTCARLVSRFIDEISGDDRT